MDETLSVYIIGIKETGIHFRSFFVCVVEVREDRHQNGCVGDQRGRSNA